MSYGTWTWVKTYARIREAFLQRYPQKRLIPEHENGDTPPLITLGAEGKKIGVIIALVALILASSGKKS